MAGSDRVILHSDLNSFYASVEMMLDPDLKGRAVAVCGSVENRHGIILAKSEKAKKAGVKTGQAAWEAKQACPGLILVPPQYDQYVKMSRLVRSVYMRYTDTIEPFGMDECWLDVTGSRIYGTGEEIAEDIRETVKREFGLTVSIGVSFSKILAKLGSDMKKPDAVTVLDGSNWRERVWPLDVSELLYVGRATGRKLAKVGIRTIGDLAAVRPDWMRQWFGKNGIMLWRFANGLDGALVRPCGYTEPVKSLGHGITCSRDLKNGEEVWRVMLDLSQNIGRRLREYSLAACGVQVYVRDRELAGEQYQCRLETPTQNARDIALAARKLFESRYRWDQPVRAVCVRGITLIPHEDIFQLDLFGNENRRLKYSRLESCVDSLRQRFGEHCVRAACLTGGLPVPEDGRDEVVMPGWMYR